MSRQPTFFIPHGAGPCFFMAWTRGPADTWDRLAAWLGSLAGSLAPPPRALLVVSGHWEDSPVAVTGATAPALIYDYYGFPPETYQLRWDAPGSPELAGQVCRLLGAAGIRSRLDPARGFDHGVFVPFKLILPAADLPVVQLSLDHGLDPARHLAIGRALAGLRDDGVLIVGTGMSFHNMQGYGDPAFGPVADRFDDWLTRTVEADPAAREAALEAWAEAPSARLAHPREEHLLPLMVAAGAARGEAGRRVFTDRVMETRISAFRFG